MLTNETAAVEWAAMEMRETEGENMEIPDRNPVNSMT
jgi:hypothetical protein